MLATACNKEDSAGREGQGAVSFKLSGSIIRDVTGEQQTLLDKVKDKLTFRIYSVSNRGESTETKSLVRLYSYNEIIGDGQNPMQIWLLAGDYCVTVEGGEKSEASFTDIYYKGQTDFRVEEAMSNHEIAINLRPANVMVKVVFDNSVATNMGSSAKLIGAFTNEATYADAAGYIATKSIPSLTYTGSMTGYYYTLNDEEWPARFVWQFSGTVSSKGNVEVKKEGVYFPLEGFKNGYMYTLTFKYSPDLGGYLTLNVTVEDQPTEYSNVAIFKPEPQFDSSVVVAEGYDNIAGQTAQMYSGKKVGYNIKAISKITSLEISLDETKLSYSAETVMGTQSSSAMRSGEATYTEYKDEVNGVTIRVLNDKEWNLLLEPAFSAKLGAGHKEYIVSVSDESGATAEYVQEYIGEGIDSVAITPGKEWEGEATFTANIYNPNAGTLTLHYKENVEGEYKSVNMTKDGQIATANVTGLRGARIYNAYVTYKDNSQTQIQTAVAELHTPNGAQIPNGNMETWSGSTPKYPYDVNSVGEGTNKSNTWDSGNHGSAKASTNLTTPVTDIRPGSSGQYAAQLQSKKATVLGIGKFAAGNIFFGRYVDTEKTTNGIIDFGQPFTYDYKPNKLVVWYKGTVGTINEVGDGSPVSSGSSDKAQIYVWLYNKDKGGVERFRVRTAYSSTFISPEGKYVNDGDEYSTSHKTGDNVEGLVAYGYWNRTQSETQVNGVVVDMTYSGWTKLEIPLVYVDNDTKPNMLVISCAASAYGDYFTGSTSSVMYLDDFEFVY